MADQLLTSPLNRIPEGLLDFFQIKSMGQYPQRLGDQVVPMMDLLRWYADAYALEGFTVSANIVANTAAGFIDFDIWGGANFASLVVANQTIVPATESWLILEASIGWDMDNAGHVADFGMVATMVDNTTSAFSSHVLTDGALNGFNTGAAIARSGGRRMLQPFFARPGSRIRAWNMGTVVPAGIVRFHARMRLLRLQR